jgi:hypothetical protein
MPSVTPADPEFDARVEGGISTTVALMQGTMMCLVPAAKG